MRQLQKHGFLTIWEGQYCPPTVIVHDFYLEFAAAVEEASKYYWSSSLRWSKAQRNQAIEVSRNTDLGLRTVVLELEEGCEEFQISPRFSSVKAMLLRNCKSLKILWGFANLASLVTFEIRNCLSLKWVELPASGCEQPYLQMVRWSNQGEKRCYGKGVQQQNRWEALSMFKKRLWMEIQEFVPRLAMMRRRVMEVDGLLLQMRGLEVLRLENTGIRQLVELSGCLPQLRVLEVREHLMKQFRVCNLPNLEHFEYFGDAAAKALGPVGWYHNFNNPVVQVSVVPRKGVMTRRDFLAGCPKLQYVYVQCASFEDELHGIKIASSHLKDLWVNCLGNTSRLPDVTAAAESLERLLFSDCQELISLNFGFTYRNLQSLHLLDCPNITEVTELDGLPNLSTLEIVRCKSLKTVSGLGGLVSLRDFEVGTSCSNLQCCLLPDLESLMAVRRIVYCGPWLMDGAFNVRKLVHLEILQLGSAITAGMLVGVESLNSLGRLDLQERREQTIAASCSTLPVDMATLLGLAVPYGPSFLSALTWLRLGGLKSLTSLDGIEFLASLRDLRLEGLPNLTCLQGIGHLRELLSLELRRCASVEELPSLSALSKLHSIICEECDKLSSVEKCGGLQQVKVVRFGQCKSLAHFPLTSREQI